MDKIKTWRLAVAAAILALLCAYAWILRSRELEEPPRPDLALIPAAAGGFVSVDEYLEPESLRLLGADTTLARSYERPDGAKIELFIGYFAAQQENSQIHSPKHCYPGSGWDIISEGSARIRIGDRAIPVKQLVISDGRQERLVIYWFSMHGRIIPNEFALKYNQMKSALLSRPQAAAFIRFSSEITEGGSEVISATMGDFIALISPDIEAALGEEAPGLEKRGRI